MMMVIFYKFNLENTSDNINNNIIKGELCFGPGCAQKLTFGPPTTHI